jgi:hypothetical protein
MEPSSHQSPSEPSTAFPHQAAKASWVCAVIVFLLVAFGGRTGAKAILELVALVIMAIGSLLGIVALFGIPKHGAKGILAPALVGIILNGLLIFIFVTNFMATRAKAQGMRSQFQPATFSRCKV